MKLLECIQYLTIYMSHVRIHNSEKQIILYSNPYKSILKMHLLFNIIKIYNL